MGPLMDTNVEALVLFKDMMTAANKYMYTSRYVRSGSTASS